MTLSSYSDVFSIDHERPHEEDIRPGDVVRTGENSHPQYEVIAIDGEKAWVRNVENSTDALALLSRCRKIPTQALMAAQ